MHPSRDNVQGQRRGVRTRGGGGVGHQLSKNLSQMMASPTGSKMTFAKSP